jgi:hypothetical protein
MSEEEIDKDSLLEQYKSEYLNRQSKTPDLYFENFESRLMDRISSEKYNSKKTLILLKNPGLYRLLAIAASVLILISVGIFAFISTGKTEKSHHQLLATDVDQEIKQLKKEEVQAFLENEKPFQDTKEKKQPSEVIKSHAPNSDIETIIDIPLYELKNMDEEEAAILDDVEISELLAQLSEDDLSALKNDIIR